MLKFISKEKKEVWVGLIFMAVMAIILFFSYSSPHNANEINKNSYLVSAHFNKTDGIMVGDKVRLSGVPVGEIAMVSLDNNFGVNIKIKLPKKIKLPEDTSAAIHTNGFFGKKYIELNPGGMYENIPDGGAILYTQDSMLIEDLLDRIISIGRSLRGLSDENKNQDGEQNES